MAERLGGYFGKEHSEEILIETEHVLSEEEKAADFAYLKSLYILFDKAIAQHLDPVIVRLNQDIISAWQEQTDRDRILNLMNINQRLTDLTIHRSDESYRDTIALLHQSALHSDVRARREAILAAWLSDNVLTIDVEARRYQRREGDGASDTDLKEMFDRLIAQLDATTTEILTALKVELIGEYRAIVRFEPKSHELRYDGKISQGQRSEILVRGARFTLSEIVLIPPTVRPEFYR